MLLCCVACAGVLVLPSQDAAEDTSEEREVPVFTNARDKTQKEHRLHERCVRYAKVAQGCRAANQTPHQDRLPNMRRRISLVNKETFGLYFLLVAFLFVLFLLVVFLHF